MLIHLSLENFILVESLELDLLAGMTVITGRTGAGKSILIDALTLALGKRADNKLVRHGGERCQIQAIFDVSHNPTAQQWLNQCELNNESECIVRRIITRDGRSRSYINGCATPLAQVRELAPLLVNIHGQHEHQALLTQDIQRGLLDAFAQHGDLQKAVANAYRAWHETAQSLQTLQDTTGDAQQVALWHYQLDEFMALDLQADELTRLEQEQKQLQHANELITNCQEALSRLDGEGGHAVNAQLNAIRQSLTSARNLLPELNTAGELLEQAQILCQEASHEIQQQSNQIIPDEQRLSSVNERLQSLHDLARKHQINPNALMERQTKLRESITTFEQKKQTVNKLETQLAKQLATYQQAASQLAQSREKQAKKLSTALTTLIQRLGMQHGHLSIEHQYHADATPNKQGNDHIDFLVTTNPKHPPQSLRKVASGGELSRISLAIQTVTAHANQAPTLIFDEVDTGISGDTATIVGQLLRQLSQHTQLICITHLPQVAAFGQQHINVHKSVVNEEAQLLIEPLDPKQRIQEMARLLGGLKITPETLAHAQQMLETT